MEVREATGNCGIVDTRWKNELPLVDIALVFEDVERLCGSGGAFLGSKGALSELSSSEQTSGIAEPGGSSLPYS